LQDSQHSTLALYKRARPCLPDFFLFPLLVEALLSASFASELPGAGERQNQKALPQPRTSCIDRRDGSPERPLHPALVYGRVIARAGCLRPQAEFARASGRGLRRVKNIVQDAKGMCKKNDSLKDR
jgi:hypothetical protein